NLGCDRRIPSGIDGTETVAQRRQRTRDGKEHHRRGDGHLQDGESTSSAWPAYQRTTAVPAIQQFYTCHVRSGESVEWEWVRDQARSADHVVSCFFDGPGNRGDYVRACAKHS